ncbi:Quinate/shikimate dehydrogenase [Pyrroloquinoline-quinone] [Klebsiella pneumoniae IS22]|nr:Quinate/shikimate dehydrogenase [Pyrroloquinoline-quinone] [Klebsiella pneumoniae IS22]
MNWGSVSLDPNNSLMFVNDMRLGLANYMVPRAKVAKDASGIEMGIVPMEGTPFGAMRERFLSPLGIPCQKPPFGTMSAVDLKTGKLVWQVPVGTVEDTGPLGIRMHMPIPIGMRPLAHRWQRSPDCCSSPAPRISTCAPLIPRTAKRSGNRVCRSAASPAR